MKLGTLATVVWCASTFGCGGNAVSLRDGAHASGGAGGRSSSAGDAGLTENSGPSGTAGVPDVSSNGGTNTGSGMITTGPSSGGASSTSCSDAVALGGGWERCKNGIVHRAVPGTCTYQPRRTPLPSSGGTDECKFDTDCAAKPNGTCLSYGGNTKDGTPPTNYCAYGCLADADCAAKEVCVCGSPAGVCTPEADCKSDLDCQANMLCAPFVSGCGVASSPAISFACQAVTDQCVTDADCASPEPTCWSNGDYRVCRDFGCPSL